MSTNDSKQEQAKATTDCTRKEPTEVSREQEQAEMQKRYLQQQQRLACPGCGESPFLG